MLKKQILRVLFGILLLASLYLPADSSANRLRSLSGKVKCDCGCGDILSECPRHECTRRPVLNREISDAVARGGSDRQILKAYAANHGTVMLAAPLFQGFDMLLWIVPIIMAACCAATAVMYSIRKTAGT